MPGPDLSVALSQQPRNEQDQFPWNVESDTLEGPHGAFPGEDDLWRDRFYREFRVFPGLSPYAHVSAQMTVMLSMPGFALAKKASLGANRWN